jgi:hypothetical protein
MGMSAIWQNRLLIFFKKESTMKTNLEVGKNLLIINIRGVSRSNRARKAAWSSWT